MPGRKRSDLSRLTRRAKRMRARRARESSEVREARRAAVRQHNALTRLRNATYEMPAWMAGAHYHHFTPDQFERNRADGRVKLKPNAIPTMFFEYKLQMVRKAPAVRKKVLKRPRRCSVAGCKSNSRPQDETVSTFPLPRNERLKREWLRNIPSDISRWKKPVICVKHFGDECFVRKEQCIVDGEGASALETRRKLKPNAVPTIFPKHTTKNQSLKQRITPRKSQMGDNTKKKPHSHSQKSLQAAKNDYTAQGEQIIAGSIGEMMEVGFYPHMCSVNVNQEPEDFVNEEVDWYTHMCKVNIKHETEDYENEMLGRCANEEFAEDGLLTTECNVFIKEEPELELDVDIEENDLDNSGESPHPDQTPIMISKCSRKHPRYIGDAIWLQWAFCTQQATKNQKIEVIDLTGEDPIEIIDISDDEEEIPDSPESPPECERGMLVNNYEIIDISEEYPEPCVHCNEDTLEVPVDYQFDNEDFTQEEMVNKFAETFVPQWCLASIKQEEV